MLIAFYKPYGVLSQFTPDSSANRTLAEFSFPAGVYPVGRLDADSEGLLLLTDETVLNQRLLNPSSAHPREYWVQVEGIPDNESLKRLASGILIRDYTTKPCKVWLPSDPDIELLPEREPPIRFRKAVPTTWLALELTEGKNRQVRRMTAAVGFPTLRLVRTRIGALRVQMLSEPLQSGFWRLLTDTERTLVLKRP